jgi:hypothetical protein
LKTTACAPCATTTLSCTGQAPAHITFHEQDGRTAAASPRSSPPAALSLQRNHNMNTRIVLTTTLAASLIALAGCAVTRGQETVGAYVDDAGITTSIKSRFVDNRDVDAASIKVETLNGTVMLSGFAKSATERNTAEQIARNVTGVKMVRNEIAVRP